MPTRIGLLILFSVYLSGCSIMSQEQHQQTLDAINKIETNLKVDMLTLNKSLTSNQSQTTILEQQVAAVSDAIKILRHNLEIDAANKPTTQIVYVDKQVPAPLTENKTILGEQEWVWIDAANANFKARIDTGATTSSLNATDIQEFERDGKTWVKFKLAHSEAEIKNAKDDDFIEAPVKRWVKIRQASSEELERRPVVDLRIRLGSLHEKTQFTLADRSQMEFPVLLGREFFKDIAMVDVSQSFIHQKYVAEKK